MAFSEIALFVAGMLIGGAFSGLAYAEGHRRGVNVGAEARRSVRRYNMPDDPGARPRPPRVVQGATGLDDIAAAIAATGPPIVGHDDHDD